MNFDEYQKKSAKYDLATATNDLKDSAFIEKILGLAGEAGEAADDVKKILRDKNGVPSLDDKDAIVKELGDVLWYVAGLARYLEVPLSEVAATNIEKLESRYQRDKLHGKGDER